MTKINEWKEEMGLVWKEYHYLIVKGKKTPKEFAEEVNHRFELFLSQNTQEVIERAIEVVEKYQKELMKVPDGESGFEKRAEINRKIFETLQSLKTKE